MDIYFDKLHDLGLKNQDLRFTEPDEDLKQRLTIHLQFLLDEWFLNTSVGIPYTQTIFEFSDNNLKELYVFFNKEIKNTEGVETITNLEITLDKDSRTLNLNLKVNGVVTVEVVI